MRFIGSFLVILQPFSKDTGMENLMSSMNSASRHSSRLEYFVVENMDPLVPTPVQRELWNRDNVSQQVHVQACIACKCYISHSNIMQYGAEYSMQCST